MIGCLMGQDGWPMELRKEDWLPLVGSVKDSVSQIYG